MRSDVQGNGDYIMILFLYPRIYSTLPSHFHTSRISGVVADAHGCKSIEEAIQPSLFTCHNILVDLYRVTSKFKLGKLLCSKSSPTDIGSPI